MNTKLLLFVLAALIVGAFLGNYAANNGFGQPARVLDSQLSTNNPNIPTPSNPMRKYQIRCENGASAVANVNLNGTVSFSNVVGTLSGNCTWTSIN